MNGSAGAEDMSEQRVSDERLDKIEDMNEGRQSDGEGAAHWLSADMKLALDRDLPRIIADLRDARKALAEAQAEIAEMREDYAGLIRFAESIGIHGSESASEAFTTLCHRWEEAQAEIARLRAAMVEAVSDAVYSTRAGLEAERDAAQQQVADYEHLIVPGLERQVAALRDALAEERSDPFPMPADGECADAEVAQLQDEWSIRSDRRGKLLADTAVAAQERDRRIARAACALGINYERRTTCIEEHGVEPHESNRATDAEIDAALEGE